jgi:uroporphyrinogen decarboxylase
MTSRERILCAINHRQPDRQPLDLGSNYTTSLVVEAYEELKKHLGLQTPTELLDQMQRAVEVEEEVLREFDIDVRGINYGNPEDIPQDDLGPEAYRDAWGIVRVRPPGSFYHDQIVFPLAGEITARDILNYSHPDPEHPGWTRPLRSRLAWI